MSSRLRYHALRGLSRSFSLPLPSSRSQVHLTSAEVNGLPSCHLTPWRNLNVSSLASSLQAHSVARSGTIVSGLFCATCWSYITRLLKTPIIGRNAAPVASSCSDMLAGLSKNEILRMPPDFCADALVAAPSASSNGLTTTSPSKVRFMTVLPLFRSPRAARGQARTQPLRLPVEPEILVAITVVDVVDHDGHPFDPGVAAGCLTGIENDRSRDILDQPALDLPHQFLALLRVGLHRLLVDQLVD